MFQVKPPKDPQTNFVDEYPRRSHLLHSSRANCSNFGSNNDLLAYPDDPALVEVCDKVNRQQHHHYQNQQQPLHQHHRSKDRREEAYFVNEDVLENCDKGSMLNLDDIKCPGCREAVVNEVLLQKR